MSWQVVTTEVADSDIRNIASYIAFDNSLAAVQFGQELWTALGRIAENPEIGRVVPEFSALRVARISRRFSLPDLLPHCRPRND